MILPLVTCPFMSAMKLVSHFFYKWCVHLYLIFVLEKSSKGLFMPIVIKMVGNGGGGTRV